MKLYALLFCILFGPLITACSGGGGGGGSDVAPISAPPPVVVPTNSVISDPGFETSLPLTDNSQREKLSVLLVGNSHSIGLRATLERLLSSGQTDKEIDVQTAPGSGFLADRVDDGRTKASLESAGWSHVILQAQKYSSSGQRTYPTTAAEYWIRGSKIQGATPILFPEHPSRGNIWEGQFLQDLHRSIAQSEAACVAPIGPAWDEVVFQQPNLILHQTDGNHASQTGMYLTSLVLYQVITGDTVESIPHLTDIGIDAATQVNLKAAASSAVFNYQPCFFEG